MTKKIPGLTINQSEYQLENGGKGKIAVFIYAGSGDPKQMLDYAIHEYVGNNHYHELMDVHMDNPWMRVVLSDINNMHQELFDASIHKL